MGDSRGFHLALATIMALTLRVSSASATIPIIQPGFEKTQGGSTDLAGSFWWELGLRSHLSPDRVSPTVVHQSKQEKWEWFAICKNDSGLSKYLKVNQNPQCWEGAYLDTGVVFLESSSTIYNHTKGLLFHAVILCRESVTQLQCRQSFCIKMFTFGCS